MSETPSQSPQPQSWLQTIVNQRLLAYVSEVGESLRPVIPRHLVNTGYVISGLYVAAETAMYRKRLYEERNIPCNFSSMTRLMDRYVDTCTLDRGIWHTFASMGFPAFAVNRTVHLSRHVISKMTTSALPKRYFPTLIAMSIIPFIVHPIDDAVDYCMDKSIRKLYFKRCIF